MGLSVILATLTVLALVPHHASAQAAGNFSGDAASDTVSGATQDYLDVVSNSEGHMQTLHIPADQMLFQVTPHYDSQGNQAGLSLSLRPDLGSFYQQAGFYNRTKDTVFIYPSFTQAAYGQHGFYDYYRKACDQSCLTVPIPDRVAGSQSSSIVGAWILKLLGYPYVMDHDVDKNPDILKQYKRVIVLHSEYVTQAEFDAITSHPDVVFLYPNALYALVTADYGTNTITLQRGHGYPDSSIRNGFGWRDDNSKFEYDVSCSDWNFYHRDNYTLLNCYPEYKMLTSTVMLDLLQKDDPASLMDDISSWLMYPDDRAGTEKLLDDFDITGSGFIPPWVEKPALWVSNGQISKRDFGDIIQYLSQINAIR